MKRQWTADELVDQWTLHPNDFTLIGHTAAEGRLGFAVLLKYFQQEGCFPQGKVEIPGAVVAFLAKQLGVPPDAFLRYAWTGRTIERHRTRIRNALGFHAATTRDADDLTAWLCNQQLAQDHRIERLEEALSVECRARRIEPPTTERVARLIRSAVHTFETHFYATTLAQLSPESRNELDALIGDESDEDGTEEEHDDGRRGKETERDPDRAEDSLLPSLPTSRASHRASRGRDDRVSWDDVAGETSVAGWVAQDAVEETAPETAAESSGSTNASTSTSHGPGESRAQERLTLHDLRVDPGPVGVDSVLREIAKLRRLRQIGLPADLFATLAPRVLDTYHRRAAIETPSALRAHPEPIRYTLLAALCWARQRAVTDNLIALLLALVKRISARAERRVEQAYIEEVKRVHGKAGILYRVAEAALATPDGTVRAVVFPVVPEATLRDLVKEYKASGAAYREQVQLVMSASFKGHYRRILPPLLEVLDFRSNNALHRPVIQALDLVRRYVDSGLHLYPADEAIPLEGVVDPGWRDRVFESDPDGTQRVNRVNYELCALRAVREAVRTKEVWIPGARRYRNPDEDAPSDFNARREEYCAALNQPLAAQEFVARVRTELEARLAAFNTFMGRTLPPRSGRSGARIATTSTSPTSARARDGRRDKRDAPANWSTHTSKDGKVRILAARGGWISLTPFAALPEPLCLPRLKAEVAVRWPMTGLLDILKETALRTGFTDVFSSLATREVLERQTLQKRLLLCLYALGTNAGLKRLAGADAASTYADLRHVRRRYLTKEQVRAAIAEVANAIFRVRQVELWGEGTSACASDSKKFGAWDQNLMTEWSLRHFGRGVMVYWQVEHKAVCVYSQLKTVSSSEVAAMLEGVLRHGTDLEIQKQYVDSHGQSEVAFAFCHLLGFRLLPRLKDLGRQRLYLPEVGQRATYANLTPIIGSLEFLVKPAR